MQEKARKLWAVRAVVGVELEWELAGAGGAGGAGGVEPSRCGGLAGTCPLGSAFAACKRSAG